MGIVPGGDPKPGNSAPFPSRPSRKPSYPSQYGAKFDRGPPASRFPSAESPQIVIAVARQDGRFGIGWGPSYPEGDKSRPSASWEHVSALAARRGQEFVNVRNFSCPSQARSWPQDGRDEVGRW